MPRPEFLVDLSNFDWTHGLLWIEDEHPFDACSKRHKALRESGAEAWNCQDRRPRYIRQGFDAETSERRHSPAADSLDRRTVQSVLGKMLVHLIIPPLSPPRGALRDTRPGEENFFPKCELAHTSRPIPERCLTGERIVRSSSECRVRFTSHRPALDGPSSHAR